jgi:hypothetical protein
LSWQAVFLVRATRCAANVQRLTHSVPFEPERDLHRRSILQLLTRFTKREVLPLS